jgi:hypothetical protein
VRRRRQDLGAQLERPRLRTFMRGPLCRMVGP